jgi:hypothetical protein
MNRSDKSRDAISRISRTGGVRISSAEGRGVGKTTRGTEDAKALARESAERARRIAGHG